MFGLSMGELFLILLVALLVFGPRKLPEMARSLGKAMRSFQEEGQKAASVFRDVMDDTPPRSRAGVVDRPDPTPAISAEPAAPQAAPAGEPVGAPGEPAPGAEAAPEPAPPDASLEGNGRAAVSRPTPVPEAPAPPPEPIDPETRLLEDT